MVWCNGSHPLVDFNFTAKVNFKTFIIKQLSFVVSNDFKCNYYFEGLNTFAIYHKNFDCHGKNPCNILVAQTENSQPKEHGVESLCHKLYLKQKQKQPKEANQKKNLKVKLKLVTKTNMKKKKIRFKFSNQK